MIRILHFGVLQRLFVVIDDRNIRNSAVVKIYGVALAVKCIILHKLRIPRGVVKIVAAVGYRLKRGYLPADISEQADKIGCFARAYSGAERFLKAVIGHNLALNLAAACLFKRLYSLPVHLLHRVVPIHIGKGLALKLRGHLSNKLIARKGCGLARISGIARACRACAVLR